MRMKMRARSRNCFASKIDMLVGTSQTPEMTHLKKELNTYAKSVDWSDCQLIIKPDLGCSHMTKPTYLGSDTLHMGEAIYYSKPDLE